MVRAEITKNQETSQPYNMIIFIIIIIIIIIIKSS